MKKSLKNYKLKYGDDMWQIFEDLPRNEAFGILGILGTIRTISYKNYKLLNYKFRNYKLLT